jgi:phenylalanyl-tRNA synthetase alpha chain
MQDLLAELLRALTDAWACALVVRRNSPVVSVDENYRRLHYPDDGPARASRYTRYISSDQILRTQTSASIPSLLAEVAPAGLRDVLLACPGLVYRRDSIDRIHSGEIHQLDLWRVAARPLGPQELDEMVQLVVAAAVPGRELRVSASPHPYTVGGIQVDLNVDGRWVEIGECGVVLPALLTEAGLDADVGGLAMGLGLDRLLMLRKGIDDIRLLRADDPRVRRQMVDLSPYQAVSSMPPIRRDISVMVPAGSDDESVGDRIRDALGADAEAIESVEIRGRTRYSALPAVARNRMGANAGQENLLIRLTLRHPDRSLTDREANDAANRAYRGLHVGSRLDLAED